MDLIVSIIIGCIIGWLASIVMKTNAQQGILLNILVGIAGAFLAGLLGAGNINAGITVGSIVMSLIGAIVLLAVVNLIRRGTVR